MTDHLPAVPQDDLARQEHVQRTSGALRPLREAIAAAGDQARTLAQEGDYEALSYGYAELKKVAADLRVLVGEVEQHIVNTTPHRESRKGNPIYDPFTIEHVGTFEILRKGATRAWDSEALLERLVMMGLYGDTGEAPPPETVEAVKRVVAILIDTVPFTKSLGWRIRALEALGLQVDEWCEETRPPGYSVKLTASKEDK